MRIYAIRWDAPFPEDDLDIHLIEVEAIANHTLYERFAERVQSREKRRPKNDFRLVGGGGLMTASGISRLRALSLCR